MLKSIEWLQMKEIPETARTVLVLLGARKLRFRGPSHRKASASEQQLLRKTRPRPATP